MRILALDYGRRRIGLALSDALGIMAHGLETLHRKNIRTDLTRLQEIVSVNDVSQLVVGNPLHMSGEESEIGHEAAAFAARLAGQCQIPFVMWDERMSSMEANRYLRDAGQRGRTAGVDRMAAEIILNSYLTANR